jgi:hypothetical protein
MGAISDFSDKSAMKMRNSGDVPGTRGERARQEAVGVVDEVGNNLIDDLLGKPGGRRGTYGRRFRRGTPQQSIFGSGLTSVQDTLSE